MTDINQKTSLKALDSTDKDAWTALLKDGIPKIYSMLIKRRINPSLAEELTQKTVFDAIRGKDTFDPAKGSPQSWLMGIANNNLAAELRKRSIREVPGSDIVGYIEAIDRKLLPDEILEKEETVRLVTRAMDRLDKREKAALILKYHENLNAKDIAIQMGMTAKAVHSLLYRARISLGDKLKSMAPSLKEANKK